MKIIKKLQEDGSFKEQAIILSMKLQKCTL